MQQHQRQRDCRQQLAQRGGGGAAPPPLHELPRPPPAVLRRAQVPGETLAGAAPLSCQPRARHLARLQLRQHAPAQLKAAAHHEASWAGVPVAAQ